MVVLSVGMEISEACASWAQRLGVELDEYGFCHTVHFDPLQTSTAGHLCHGPFREPKDIPESVIEASGAAALLAGCWRRLADTLTRRDRLPAGAGHERRRSPRSACLSATADPTSAAFWMCPTWPSTPRPCPAWSTPSTISTLAPRISIAHITEQVKELGLNRVVVASCTPLTHEPLFQSCHPASRTEPASVRDGQHPQPVLLGPFRRSGRGDGKGQRTWCGWRWHGRPSWSHCTRNEVPVEKTALVIGGGLAGMTAALTLADQGFPVHLVERRRSWAAICGMFGTLWIREATVMRTRSPGLPGPIGRSR